MRKKLKPITLTEKKSWLWENEVSALRKTDISKAYFGCHTDITIPYDEIGEITAVTKAGERDYHYKEWKICT